MGTPNVTTSGVSSPSGTHHPAASRSRNSSSGTNSSHKRGGGGGDRMDKDKDSTSELDPIPPFLPLEESGDGTASKGSESSFSSLLSCKKPVKITGKQIVSTVMFSIIGLVIWDALLRPPEERLLRPDFSLEFLQWVQEHPVQGLAAFLIVFAVAVILMIPIGTPLTLGCGFIYKGAYGWQAGLIIATLVSMAGSAIGAVACFLLGRYLMRDQVRRWIKKYPLFVAIDVAAAEHGLRIMAMLYLTPILPLGPVSYMCGSTSMSLSNFVLAKVASFPLMFFYVFIGASTGALLGNDSKAAAAEVKSIEENESLIAAGIILSFVMIGFISHYIKKELNKILERQKKHKPGEMTGIDDSNEIEEAAIEMGVTAARQRRMG